MVDEQRVTSWGRECSIYEIRLFVVYTTDLDDYGYISSNRFR